MKKMSTFKSKKVILWIEDILRYFPQCDKKMLWSYPELGDSILNMLLENLNKADLDKYDLYAHIWLLGEYKHTKSRDKIEEIFINSYETTNKFLNTTATEAILKIGTCSDNFIENITEYLNYTKDYYFIRNILLILNNSELNKFDEIINNLDIETYDKRVKLFIEWICNNKNKNLIEEVNLLPDEIIDKYRDYYPMEETYSGYKSL